MTDAADQTLNLGRYEAGARNRIASLDGDRFVARLWQKDASLWAVDAQGQGIIGDSLGWLDVAEKMVAATGELDDFAAEARDAGFRHLVYMGMGGSSLCPLVLERSFSMGKDGMPLTVIDTTDPETVLAVERRAPLTETLFFVASKSGTTAEPLAFGEYFYGRLRELAGDNAGANMAVVTDPGSPLIDTAEDRRYRRVFLNFPDIGGRFSALSYFGLVPAALMGIDVKGWLSSAVQMTNACRAPAADNPGVELGAVMGELALRGRNKVTLVVPDAVAAMSAWLEQLLAESTGKEGTGLIPVAGEPLGEPDEYGDDRLFVYTRLEGATDDTVEVAIDDLIAAGQPVVTVNMAHKLDLGGEFYRWEIATATAGAVLGINAFDQPNVQESKDNTNRLLAVAAEGGRLPEDEPALVEGPLSIFGDKIAGTIAETLAAFLGQAGPGDYLAILAYLTESEAVDEAIMDLRLVVRGRLKLATTSGYGPRYLHSTGQLHKGGPNTGLFLELTAGDTEDAAIPGAPYGFSTFKSAQARGDLEALAGHGRRALRVDLGEDVAAGLAALTVELKRAM